MKYIAMLLLLVTQQAFSEPAAKIKFAVTYYDYHSDGSCPDFNPVDDREGITQGMVGATLDADGLPTAGSRVYFNQQVNKWFRPFSEHENKTLVPTYKKSDADSSQHGLLESEATVAYDTAYKNILIEDSLEFSLIDAGKELYEYDNSAFFPLDDRGFGKEPTLSWDGLQTFNDHNYSFGMKLEKKFVYRAGEDMTFHLRGDDDLWVFVDGKLVRNSCEAIEDPSQKMTIILARKNNTIWLEIRNEGAQVSKEVVERVKDPFFTTRQDDGGTGLGLYIANTIIKEHQGRLVIKPWEHGTIVTVSIPLCQQ